jgi:hypothetical protein
VQLDLAGTISSLGNWGLVGVVLVFVRASFIAEIAVIVQSRRLSRQLGSREAELPLFGIQALLATQLLCQLLLFCAPEDASWIGVLEVLRGLCYATAPTLFCMVMCRVCERTGLAAARERWRKCMMTFIACCVVPALACAAFTLQTPSAIVSQENINRNLGAWIVLGLVWVLAYPVPWIWLITLTGYTAAEMRRRARSRRGLPEPLERVDDLFQSALVAAVVGLAVAGVLLSRCLR